MPEQPADPVRAQYEALPYPERDPADEARRLVVGSPSFPQEMDHWLWGGARDWSRPLRALVAGGGTGDGLIQLAQRLTDAGRPYEITYLDLSAAARRVAEARAQARKLGHIRFLTGSLLEAGRHGPFDYIDCCGVLHHLPRPQEGFDALAGALAPGGGIGLMVYAPLGRSGVYPLQAAFGALFGHLPPAERVAPARALLARLPEGHPFRRNPHLVDHEAGDAGFFDLLLHSTDRPYTITELAGTLEAAGLELAGVPEPALYDPGRLGAELPEGTEPLQAMQIAENLRGSFNTHVAYAVPRGARVPPPLGKPGAVPHLRVDPRRLAQAVQAKGAVTLTAGGQRETLKLPRAAAPLIAGVDGRRPLSALAAARRLDPVAFAALWGPVERGLCGFGQMHYSTLLTGR